MVKIKSCNHDDFDIFVFINGALKVENDFIVIIICLWGYRIMVVFINIEHVYSNNIVIVAVTTYS